MSGEIFWVINKSNQRQLHWWHCKVPKPKTPELKTPREVKQLKDFATPQYKMSAFGAKRLRSESQIFNGFLLEYDGFRTSWAEKHGFLPFRFYFSFACSDQPEFLTLSN